MFIDPKLLNGSIYIYIQYIYETKVYHDHRHPFVLHSIEMATVAIEVQQLMNQSLEALMDVSKAINLQ